MNKELIAQTALQIQNMLSGFDEDQQTAILFQVMTGGDLALLPIRIIARIIEATNGEKAIISLNGEQVHFKLVAGDGKSLDLGQDKK